MYQTKVQGLEKEEALSRSDMYAVTVESILLHHSRLQIVKRWSPRIVKSELLKARALTAASHMG